MHPFDFLLIGGGLQSGLAAAALAHCKNGARVCIVEREVELGGNHTWCFHTADVPPAARPFVEPFVAARWPKYHVQFPRHERSVSEPYAAVTVASFRAALAELERAGKLTVRREAEASSVDAEGVVLTTGEQLRAKVVVDARGPAHPGAVPVLGFQKFLGLELEVEAGSAPPEPILMDATVEQLDGFRFVYVLPLTSTRVLVEDTYFADGPEVDRVRLRERVFAYAERLGLGITNVAREEVGVLPLPDRAPVTAPTAGSAVQGGYQGGWFHPLTGYSFPLAVRFALALTRHEPDGLIDGLTQLAHAEQRQQRFALLLSRMLFRGFAPEQRFAALERFYRLPEDTIRRFYSLELTAPDRLRILCGRPPRGFSFSRYLQRAKPATALAPLPPGAA